MATDEEVEKQRAAVVELRARLEEAQSGGDQEQHELENDIQMAALKEEEVKLQTQLAELEQTNANRVRGALPSFGALREQMAAAAEHQKVVATTVVNGGTEEKVSKKDANKDGEGR